MAEKRKRAEGELKPDGGAFPWARQLKRTLTLLLVSLPGRKENEEDIHSLGQELKEP